MCPKGDDPVTRNQQKRKFQLDVSSSLLILSGSLGFGFGGEYAFIDVSSSASSENCKASLEASYKFERVTCTYIEVSNRFRRFVVQVEEWPTYPGENNLFYHNGNPSINDLVDLDRYKRNTLFVHKNNFNLLFVGSLNMKMNKDAIVYFCRKYYPKIRKAFGSKITVNIVGRKPSKLIKEICKENGLNLFGNVSNIELISFYQNSNLLLMPFPYTCGFKLKFIEAIENGIPVLGTNCVNFSKKDKLPISLFSDDDQDWLKHIEFLISLDEREISKQRKNIQEYAVNYSKTKIKKEFISLLGITV